MAQLTVRGFAKKLGVSHTHVLRLITRGVVDRNADGLIDEDAARAAIDASRSVAHGYLDEVNQRQREAHRGAKTVPTPAPAPAEAAGPVPQSRARNRKSSAPAPAPAAPEAPSPHVSAGPAPDPALQAERMANRSRHDTARADRERAAADLARLEYQRKTGELVARTTAERVLFNCARRARDAWMRFPTQVAPLIAAEVGLADPDVLRTALTTHVTQLLTKLGGEGVDFDDPDA